MHATSPRGKETMAKASRYTNVRPKRTSGGNEPLLPLALSPKEFFVCGGGELVPHLSYVGVSYTWEGAGGEEEREEVRGGREREEGQGRWMMGRFILLPRHCRAEKIHLPSLI